MKVVVQRVKNSSVHVDGKLVGKSGYGFMLLVSFTEGDNEDIINYMVNKIVNLRIMDDDNHVMNKSILDIKGSILSISQFTLYGDTKKGNRPSYIKALRGEDSVKLYDLFNEKLSKYVPVETGIFGAFMEVSLINDGPVTIILEKENL
ncbi:MAG: D-tyrosyl-tRNA(Tyr) deacylase [Bacilli bacterium]|nr:D-tyrosyl-tRNA(Tyr) deacylase [Bacilli bacterium]